MTEAYVARPSTGVKLEKVTYADPGPRMLLVDIVTASICHTDVKAAEGTFHIKPPLILGHEGAGYVKSVGSNVTYVKPGDAIVLSFAHCGECKFCLSGRQPYCLHLPTWNFSGRAIGREEGDGVVVKDEKGEAINGLFFGQSSMSRVALVHESSCVKVDVKSRQELECGIQTGAGSIWNVARSPVGSSIVIFGGGAVGLSALLAAKTTAPGALVLVDTSQTKLDIIPSEILSGVTVLNSKDFTHDALVAKLQQLSADAEGMDFALDCVGNEHVIAAAADCLTKRGTVMTIGSTSTTQAVFKTEKFLVFGLTYRGMHQGDSVPRVMIPEMIRQWRAGRFPFDKLLTRFEFKDLEKALEEMHGGRVVKSLLVV
nr:hypothetical protein B0A51_17608 [Rachicladosporium sp. CCFEE 5018]